MATEPVAELSAWIGQEVFAHCRSGEVLRGVLHSFDEGHNLLLDDPRLCLSSEEALVKIARVLVNGNNIVAIVLAGKP